EGRGRHVEDQLVPHLEADGPMRVDGNAGGAKRLGDPGEPWRLSAVELAQGEPVVATLPVHHARRVHRRRQVDDAADRTVDADAVPQASAGVQPLDLP